MMDIIIDRKNVDRIISALTISASRMLGKTGPPFTLPFTDE